jgi:hypothetical protein
MSPLSCFQNLQLISLEDGGPNSTCFLHLQYHIQDTLRRTTIQQLFYETCVEAFTEEGVPISRMIIAYKQSSNIANVPQHNCLNNRQILYQGKGLPLCRHFFWFCLQGFAWLWPQSNTTRPKKIESLSQWT